MKFEKLSTFLKKFLKIKEPKKNMPEHTNIPASEANLSAEEKQEIQEYKDRLARVEKRLAPIFEKFREIDEYVSKNENPIVHQVGTSFSVREI